MFILFFGSQFKGTYQTAIQTNVILSSFETKNPTRPNKGTFTFPDMRQNVLRRIRGLEALTPLAASDPPLCLGTQQSVQVDQRARGRKSPLRQPCCWLLVSPADPSPGLRARSLWQVRVTCKKVKRKEEDLLDINKKWIRFMSGCRDHTEEREEAEREGPTGEEHPTALQDIRQPAVQGGAQEKQR